MPELDLLFITGEARVGKTHAGKILELYFDADCFHLSDILKDMTHKHYGLSFVTDHFDAVKDLPADAFHGMTPREAYIDFSENILKPKYGPDALGIWSLDRLEKNIAGNRLTIIPGVGFVDEVKPLIDHVGPDRVVNLLIHSETHSASSRITDSRQMIDFPALGVRQLSVNNCLSDGFGPMISAALLDAQPRYPGAHASPVPIVGP